VSPLLLTLLVLSGVAALSLALWAILAPGDRMAARVSRRVGLALPAEPLRGKLVRRMRRTTRWTSGAAAAGAVVGIAGVATAAASGSIGPDDTTPIWLAFAGLVLGGAVGAVLAIVTESRSAEPGQPRVARATPRELRDYLDPIELVGARVTAVLGVATTVALLAWPAARTIQVATPVAVTLLAAAGAVALVVLEVAGRRVVLGRSRISESPAELAWDDALRSDDLRRLVTAVLMTSTYAVIFGVFPLAGALGSLLLPDALLMVAVNLAFYVLMAAAVVILVLSTVRKPARFYLRRLWPEVAAQEARAAAER